MSCASVYGQVHVVKMFTSLFVLSCQSVHSHVCLVKVFTIGSVLSRCLQPCLSCQGVKSHICLVKVFTSMSVLSCQGVQRHVCLVKVFTSMSVLSCQGVHSRVCLVKVFTSMSVLSCQGVHTQVCLVLSRCSQPHRPSSVTPRGVQWPPCSASSKIRTQTPPRTPQDPPTPRTRCQGHCSSAARAACVSAATGRRCCTPALTRPRSACLRAWGTSW